MKGEGEGRIVPYEPFLCDGLNKFSDEIELFPNWTLKRQRQILQRSLGVSTLLVVDITKQLSCLHFAAKCRMEHVLI